LRGALFSMVRELMHNAGKHARACHLEVSLKRVEDDIEICVKDDGIGFDVAEVLLRHDKRYCLGLFGIRQRIELLGGTMTIDSGREKGTRVVLRVPLKSELSEMKEERHEDTGHAC